MRKARGRSWSAPHRGTGVGQRPRRGCRNARTGRNWPPAWGRAGEQGQGPTELRTEWACGHGTGADNRVNSGRSCDPSDLTAVWSDVRFVRGPRATGLPRLVSPSCTYSTGFGHPLFRRSSRHSGSNRTTRIGRSSVVPLCALKPRVLLRLARVHMSRRQLASRQSLTIHVSDVRQPRVRSQAIACHVALDVPKPVPRSSDGYPWWVTGRGRCPMRRAKQGDSQS
jgi:hypothetical protein